MSSNRDAQLNRIALNNALKMLGDFARVSAWNRLESEFQIGLASTKPLTKQEIEHALRQMFGEGAEPLLRTFENELLKLKNE